MVRAAKSLSPSEQSPARPAAERVAAKASGPASTSRAARSGTASWLSDTINDSPAMVAQRRQIRSAFGDAAQVAQAASRAPAQESSAGLPDPLKSGIESLSGVSMDGVSVHYNSSRPAQLDAFSYAQGNEIHIAPGQERHLPHEAWHVVQQAQGRVTPTMQMKQGVLLNDDQRLEREADVMGARAEQAGQDGPASGSRSEGSAAASRLVQRRVHAWTGKGWDPGEPGREGQVKLPVEPGDAGWFFNDMTGTSGKTAKEAAQSLDNAGRQGGLGE